MAVTRIKFWMYPFTLQQIISRNLGAGIDRHTRTLSQKARFCRRFHTAAATLPVSPERTSSFAHFCSKTTDGAQIILFRDSSTAATEQTLREINHTSSGVQN
jgi:hypothetical protein